MASWKKHHAPRPRALAPYTAAWAPCSSSSVVPACSGNMQMPTLTPATTSSPSGERQGSATARIRWRATAAAPSAWRRLRATLDQHLPAPALAEQQQAMRDGHCGLLPESQIAPMARIQIARDASLAQTAQEALRSGQTVLLVAGNGHVLRHLGVPTHWPASLVSKVVVAQVEHAPAAIKSGAQADAVIQTPALPPRDVCAELREQWRPAPPGQKV